MAVAGVAPVTPVVSVHVVEPPMALKEKPEGKTTRIAPPELTAVGAGSIVTSIPPNENCLSEDGVIVLVTAPSVPAADTDTLGITTDKRKTRKKLANHDGSMDGLRNSALNRSIRGRFKKKTKLEELQADDDETDREAQRP